jgi:hypothetical protein
VKHAWMIIGSYALVGGGTVIYAIRLKINGKRLARHVPESEQRWL